jgi:hypothetical protein
MTTRPLVNVVPVLTYRTPVIGRTVHGPDMMNVAALANITALARPFRGFRLANLAPGTYVASYRRTHDAVQAGAHRVDYAARHARRRDPREQRGACRSRSHITDALGNTATGAMIPAGFKGETTATPQASGDPSIPTIGASRVARPRRPSRRRSRIRRGRSRSTSCGRSDCTSAVDTITMVEVGRTLIDTADTYGVDGADFQPGQPMVAGTSTTAGTLRLAQTIEGSIATLPTVLNLAWANDTAAAIPQTTSGTFAALTNLEQSAGTAMRFRVPIRPVYTDLVSGGTTDGEQGRWRVRYYVAGFGTAEVQLLTGSTASPYTIASLTGAAWAWSAWQNVGLPTSGTGAIATLSLKGKTSAGTLYLGAVEVQQY